MKTPPGAGQDQSVPGRLGRGDRTMLDRLVNWLPTSWRRALARSARQEADVIEAFHRIAYYRPVWGMTSWMGVSMLKYSSDLGAPPAGRWTRIA